MFINLFVSIITIAKTIAIVTNVSNSTLNIIIIRFFVERSKRFIREVIKSRDVRGARNIRNNYKKSIS